MEVAQALTTVTDRIHFNGAFLIMKQTLNLTCFKRGAAKMKLS